MVEASSETTPLKSGFSMPAEWTPHACCYISWPCRETTWRGHIAKAEAAYKEVIDAVNRFEPVTVLCDPSTTANARRALGDEIEILEVELDDSWVRDNGPIFVRSDDGNVAMVNFRFNAWGFKSTYAKDDLVPQVLSKKLNVRRYDAPMVLEGGAFSVDGVGTLLTTEQCLLNENRNPELSREDIERLLHEYLGVTRVIWLPGTVYGDITDGHVDGQAVFARERLVVAAHTTDSGNPDMPGLQKNLEHLESSTDAKGRSFEIMKVVQPRAITVEGIPTGPCYTNHYIANGGVVVPLSNLPEDRIAMETIETVYPDREVLGVDSRYIELAGGAVHCITQQQPSGSLMR